ncbi:MAG: acetyl-CoA C-acetyltransferase [Gammaproteobacteria bacterium]
MIYLVDGLRTPFLRAAGPQNPAQAADLAVLAGKQLLLGSKIDPKKIDEVIMGCVMPDPSEVNIARIIALRLGLGHQIPAWTVQRNCASGLQAIDSAFQAIALGNANLILAGGVDTMSRAPVLFSDAMVNWMASGYQAKTFFQKIKHFLKFRPAYLKPVIGLLKGLTDPIVALSMGQTAEELAHDFNISREEMDNFAVQSHLKAQFGIQNQKFDAELASYFDLQKGASLLYDNGIRSDSNQSHLAKLKPVFDKPAGLVTAGNSSQVSDGAACLLLASEAFVKKEGLKPLASIEAIAWAALDPAKMGLGPVHAIHRLLEKTGLKFSDIDYWEINEAFAAQVLACVKAMQDDDYCKRVLGLKAPLGTIDMERLNVDGGAIAIGHPVGASGARISLHLAHVLQRENANLGIASLCIGGGQGGAVLIKRV